MSMSVMIRCSGNCPRRAISIPADKSHLVTWAELTEIMLLSVNQLATAGLQVLQGRKAFHRVCADASTHMLRVC